ncbi:Ig domain-containing protein [Faecalitalea cylindroides]|uniref:Ig domain-containing protein n=1 Tax=Faecalitalea cylindroides TaxID=39483 RepID=UPI000B3A52A0|nr:Ig domain-containing protein [Faecalitalea cylindroides]OUN60417.1 hypothetical protein B5G15_07350 [Faecalitalea cylindroides]
MKKRIWNKVVSIFTAILLVVGLVPSTTVAVMAADGIELYVGGQQITESGCYENQNGTWTKVDGTEPANGQFSYDADTFTLTLNEAKIVNYQYVTVGGGITYPGSVIAFSQSADVSLKIVLSQGTSNITGTGGILVVSKAGDASLSISGPGSLEVNMDKNDSGISLIGSKNVNLNIDGADVKTLTAYYYGVELNAGDGFKAAAVVNNGKLTTGGSGAIGIYYRWTNPSDSGTSSLTVSGNAVVDTRDNKMFIDSQASEVQVSAGSDGNGGIVFDGKSGTVYGDVTLDESITINQDETLRIPSGSSLNSNNHLTNNGTIIVENGGVLTGETGGKVVYAPSITTESLPEGKVNEEYSASLTADGSEPIEWSVTQGSLPTGLNLSTNGKITGKPTAPGNYVFTVTASNGVESDSKSFSISVVDPIYSIQNSGDISFANAIEGYTPEVKTIMITNDGNQPITLNQPVSSESFEVGTLSKTTLSVGETAEFTVQPKTGLLAGSYDEDIKITGTNNGKSVSTKVNVKFNVKHNAIKVERKDPTCTEKGNIEYWYCEACRKYFQDEALTKELKQEETILLATGHNLTKVDEKKPTVDAAGNVEYWYCEVCNKYFSDEKAEHEITLEDTVIAKLPKFVSGANQEWRKGSKDGLTFKIDTDIKEFKKVLVDGKELKDTDYDIKSGSTILTLKPSFLDTLSAGKHKIRFEFNTGSVEAYFTVKDKENSSQTESANTGVQNKYGLWIVLLLVAAGGLAGFGILSKRRKNHK